MKNTILSLLLCFLGLLAKDLKAQELSVASGSAFNIKAGTVVTTAGLDVTPSTDFSLGSSMSRNNTIINASTFPSINRSYQFSTITAAFSGVLKINYQDAELNGLDESSLKLLYNNGSAWATESGSTNDTTANAVTATLTAKTLNELSLGYMIIPNTPTVLTNFNSFTVSSSTPDFIINAPNSNSTGAITYTSSNPNVATINGTIIHIVAPGTTIITATQASDGNYMSNSISASMLSTTFCGYWGYVLHFPN